jgi:uncharacterized membrane protein
VSATEPRRNKLAQSLRNSFIAGLLVIAPLGITLYVLHFVLTHIDRPLGKVINEAIQVSTGRPDLHIPGLGILATVALVFCVGWLTRIAVFRYVIRQFEVIIDRVPLVRSLYNASRQIVTPFTSKEALPFSEVCLVEYPMKGRWTVGMIARHKVSEDPDDDRVVVFFPSNHLHLGYPVVVSRREVIIIEMSVEEAIKFMLSCGVVGDNEHFRPIPSIGASRGAQNG